MKQADIEKRYLLRIELMGAHQPTWREVIVPSDLTLSLLHDVIQICMGWEDDHLHEFQFKSLRFDSVIDSGLDAQHPEEATELDEVLKRVRQKLTYIYDFGDDWCHAVTLKKILPWDENEIFVCTDGAGAAPLEDCGGVYGHEKVCNFARGLVDADDGYLTYEEWGIDEYDPDLFDQKQVNILLEEFLEELQAVDEDEELQHLMEGMVEDALNLDGKRGSQDLLPGVDAMLGPGNAVGEDDLFDEDEAEQAPYSYQDLSKDELVEFRATLNVGQKVREAAPWRDLWDQDIFCVKDPETGLLDFVSILGRGGEVFAVHVHRPPECYDFWRQSKEGTLPMHSIQDYLRRIRMVELEFLNKMQMEAEDLELYECLGYRAPKRGQQLWMRVRRYHPRAMPWYAEAELLPVLRRGASLAIKFVDAIRNEPDRAHSKYIDVGEKQAGLPKALPTFTLQENRNINDWAAWKLEVLPVDWAEGSRQVQAFSPSEFELERIAALPVTKDVWEAGAIYLDEPVLSDFGPVAPIIAVAAPTRKNGPAPMPYLSVELEETPVICLWRAFVKTAIERGVRPRKLQVKTDLAMALFKPLADQTGMQLTRCQRFVVIDTLFEMMRSSDF